MGGKWWDVGFGVLIFIVLFGSFVFVVSRFP